MSGAEMADGIYFGMPEEQYLAVPRLSKSGIKRLRISPADFWHGSWLNPTPPVLTPEQERKREVAKFIGRAYHAARLEPEKFAALYVRELSQADYAGQQGFISTGKEMEVELAKLELKKSGSVAEQAERLVAAGYSGPVWQHELAEWRASLPEGAVIIPAVTYGEIVEDMDRLRAVPAVDELLSGGEPEVSILWTCPHTGIKMKARFDYLKPVQWAEFKTFANPNGKSLANVITDAVRFNRYHIDAVSYLQATEMIRHGVVGVVGDATDAQLEMVQAIQLLDRPMACHFVFQQKGGVPNILERRFRFWDDPSGRALEELERDGATEEHLARARAMAAQSTPSPTAIHQKARAEIAAAKRDFLAYSEIYEPGQPWLPFNPSGEITDDDFHPAWLEEV